MSPLSLKAMLDNTKKQKCKWCSEIVFTEKANSVDPDETARYEPSHLDLHGLLLQRPSSVHLNGLMLYSRISSFLNDNRDGTLQNDTDRTPLSI